MSAMMAALLALGAVIAVGIVREVRLWWLQSRGPFGCPSVATFRGAGRDARPEGLRCYLRPGHRQSHLGFDPATGRTHYWAQERRSW